MHLPGEPAKPKRPEIKKPEKKANGSGTDASKKSTASVKKKPAAPVKKDPYYEMETENLNVSSTWPR